MSLTFFCLSLLATSFSFLPSTYAHGGHDARAGHLHNGHLHHRRFVSAPIETIAPSGVPKPTIPPKSPPLVTVKSTSTSFAFPTETTRIPIATICPLHKFNFSDPNMRVAEIGPPNSTFSNYTLAYPSGGPTAVPIKPSLLSIKPSGYPIKPSYTKNATDDCSTIYSTVATPSCHTTIPIPGALPITVTDCTSPITFSTSTLVTPFATPALAARDLLPPLPPLPNITHPVPINGTLPSNGTLPINGTLPGLPSGGAPMGQEIDYFLAAWTDLAYYPFIPPSTVTVEECFSGAGGLSCPDTRTESWSVVNVTTEVPVSKTVAFAGEVTAPAVLVLGDGSLAVSVGGKGVTELDLDTTFVGTSETVTESISRSVIGWSGGSTVEVSVLPVRTLTTNIAGPAGPLTLTEQVLSAEPTGDPVI